MRKPEPLFILGISPRSGTNLLANVLALHPQIVGKRIVGEDMLLRSIHHLDDYVAGVSKRWSKVWAWSDNQSMESQKAALRAALGEALQSYLRPDQEADYFLSHTPFTHNLKHFPDWFPECKLLVLVRDGAATVESGVQGGFWSYKEGMQNWRDSARRILAERDRGFFHLLRYEDLLQERSTALNTLSAYLEIEAADFAESDLNALPVFGSSTVGEKGKHVWQKAQADAQFDPLSRAAHWSKGLRRKYRKICGAEAEALGYGLP